MDDFKVPFAAYSALFRAVNNSMFINDKLSNKIVWMSNGNKEVNMEIFNEKRLKSILFKEIKSLYNDRINFHDLNLARLGEGDINNFLIERFYLVEDNDYGYYGLYEIFPKINVEFQDVMGHILKFLLSGFVKLVAKFHQFFTTVKIMGMNT